MRSHRLIAVLAAAAVSLAACVSRPNAAAPQVLTVEAVDLGFSPPTLEVTAGQPIKLTLQNNGALEHDFSVTEIPIEGTAEEAGGSGHAAGHGDSEEPDLHVSALGGQTATLEFTPTEPGRYDFWCTVAGHKEAGMIGTLVVQAP